VGAFAVLAGVVFVVGLVWLGIAIVQAVLIASAFNVKRVRRTVLVPA